MIARPREREVEPAAEHAENAETSADCLLAPSPCSLRTQR